MVVPDQYRSLRAILRFYTILARSGGATLTILISAFLYHQGKDEDQAANEEDDAAGKAQGVVSIDI